MCSATYVYAPPPLLQNSLVTNDFGLDDNLCYRRNNFEI